MIAKKTKSFGRLTKARKRVAIAKDVLKHLASRKYRPTSGTYCVITPKRRATDVVDNASAQLSKQFKKNAGRCQVCALGGMFVSAIAKFNHLTAQQLPTSTYDDDLIREGRFHDREWMISLLGRYFSRAELATIEYAFEGDGHTPESCDDDLPVGIDRPRRYRIAIPSAGRRMAVIMRNIIRNDGTFIPDPSGKR